MAVAEKRFRVHNLSSATDWFQSESCKLGVSCWNFIIHCARQSDFFVLNIPGHVDLNFN